MEMGDINTRWLVIVGVTVYVHLQSECMFGGLCGGEDHQADLASMIVALAIAMAIAAEDLWRYVSCEGAPRPPCALILLFETMISILVMCILMQYLWYPIVPYLCNIAYLFKLFGLCCFGRYLMTDEGIAHIKILVALLILGLEMMLLDVRKNRAENFGACNFTAQTFCYANQDRGTCWNECCEDDTTSTASQVDPGMNEPEPNPGQIQIESNAKE